MPLTRDSQAFDRVYVDYAVSGSARVTWEVRNTLRDPLPWDFQLQTSKDGGGDAWTDVGSEVRNTYYALDDMQRQYGKGLTLTYRVVLTTPWDTYTSRGAQILGLLSKRQWLQARAVIRRTLLDPQGLERLPGYLMKRKLYGTACTACVDPVTGGITNSDCGICSGTGRVDGYWMAAENTMFDLFSEKEDTKRSERGTVNDVIVVGSFVGIPMMHRNDVWIDAHSDRRYVISRITPVSKLNRVPLIVTAELRLVEFGDVIYSIDPAAGS